MTNKRLHPTGRTPPGEPHDVGPRKKAPPIIHLIGGASRVYPTGNASCERCVALEHLDFLYYSICYAIGLPSVAVAVIVYLRTRDETIKHALPSLAVITLQLILATILQYREANLVKPVTSGHVMITYAYFLAESATMFVLPYLAHNLADVAGGKRDAAFGLVFAAAAALIFTPFFLVYRPWQGRLESALGLYLYRAALIAVLAYSLLIVLVNYRRLAAKRIRALFWLALVFFGCWSLQMLHCKLMPLWRHLPLDAVPLAPAGYFVWNLVFLIGISKRFLHADDPTRRTAARELRLRGITEREGEVVRLLLAGRSNREIAGILHISAATVKTHILNIYRKLGVKNRVQLVNTLTPPGV